MQPHDPHHNPYMPPQGAPPGAPQGPQYPGQKPKWFMFCMVATMVLGGFGALAGLMAPINLLIGKNNLGAFGGGGVPPEMAEFQEEILAASMPELGALIGVFNLITGAFALWTAYKVMQQTPGSRAPYKNAMLGLGIYEIAALLFGVIIQVRMFSLMEGFMQRMVRDSGGAPPPPGFEQTMGAAMNIGMIVGIIFAVIWGGAKIYFALWARGYVDKDEVVHYVDGPTAAYPT